MDLRVTLLGSVTQALAETRQETDRLGVLQQQAATGKSLLSPSDGPSQAEAVLNNNAQNSRLDAYLANIKSAQATLNESVSTLRAASGVFDQAKSIALQASQSTTDPTTRQTMADQVDALLQQLLGLANTQQNGEYLFAGTKSQTAPFAVASTNSQNQPQQIAYQGGPEQQPETAVAAGQSIGVYLSGQSVFQPSAGTDAFQALINLRDALRNTSVPETQQETAISSQITELGQVQNNILQAAGAQSATLQSLDTFQSQATNLQLTTQQLLSNLQDADMPTVIVQLQEQQNQMQVTFASMAHMFDQSLLNFLH